MKVIDRIIKIIGDGIPWSGRPVDIILCNNAYFDLLGEGEDRMAHCVYNEDENILTHIKHANFRFNIPILILPDKCGKKLHIEVNYVKKDKATKFVYKDTTPEDEMRLHIIAWWEK